METTTNCCPAVRVMMGSVVSIVVAPPAEMGARFPNHRTSNGAASSVRISRLILASRADGAQLGSLVFGNEDAGERVIAESRAYGQTVRYRTVCQNQTDGCRTCQCSQYRHDGQEYQPRIE